MAIYIGYTRDNKWGPSIGLWYHGNWCQTSCGHLGKRRIGFKILDEKGQAEQTLEGAQSNSSYEGNWKSQRDYFIC